MLSTAAFMLHGQRDTIMTELDVFTTGPFAEKVCRAQLYVLISDAVVLWTPRGKRPREERRIQALVLMVKKQKQIHRTKGGVEKRTHLDPSPGWSERSSLPGCEPRAENMCPWWLVQANHLSKNLTSIPAEASARCHRP